MRWKLSSSLCYIHIPTKGYLTNWTKKKMDTGWSKKSTSWQFHYSVSRNPRARPVSSSWIISSMYPRGQTPGELVESWIRQVYFMKFYNWIVYSHVNPWLYIAAVVWLSSFYFFLFKRGKFVVIITASLRELPLINSARFTLVEIGCGAAAVLIFI